MAWVALVESVTAKDAAVLQVGIRVYDDVAPSLFRVGSADVLVADTQAQARAKVVTAGQAIQSALQADTSAETVRLARAQSFVGTTIAL